MGDRMPVIEHWRDEPRVGDVITLRHTVRFQRNAARTIIAVDPEAGKVLTSGASGRQRNRWMKFARLAAYDLVGRADAR